MDSKYTNAYEELKKKREERQKASSQTSDKYKDYADAYAALRGEKKTTSSGNTHGFYAPDAQSPAIPVKQSTAQAAIKLMQNRQKTPEIPETTLTGVVNRTTPTLPLSTAYKREVLQNTLSALPVKPAYKQKSGLSYIQSRGQEMFDEAMNAIDKTGKAAVPAVKAFFESLRSESQLQHNPVDATKEKMAQALRSGNVEDARNIEIKPVIELGKNALAAGNKAFNDSLEQQNKKDQKTRELLGKDSDYADTNPAYEKARSNSFTKVLGDLNATTAYMLPAVMMSYATGNPSSLVSSVLSAGTIAAQAYPMAFDEAKADGATTEQAGNYALREAGNQALGDMLIGGAAGVGSGILDYTVGRYAGNALNRFFGSKPMLKAVSKAASEAIGEGAEEVIQSLITTANQRTTYNPDAEIDAASVAYEGLLGALMGSVYNVPSIPGRYSVYRSDYDAVNAISKAAASVKTDGDVQKLEQTMDAMTTMCDENIDVLKAEKQTEETKDNISRLEYIRDRVSDVREELEAHKEEIITHNTDMAEALDGVVNGAADNVVENVAELVSVVEEGLEPDENAIDATIDYVVEEIRNKDEEIQEAQTPEEKRQAQIGRAVKVKVDETLRENRETIEEFLRRKHDSIDWQGIEESGNAVRRGLETIFTAPKTEQNVPVSEDVAKTTETVDKTAAIPEENSGNDTTEPLQNTSESGTMEKEFSLHHFLHTDTRDGKKLNVFQSTRRLSSEEYQKLKDYMKDVGGYYSRYAKGFIVPDASRIGEIAAFADTDYVSESTAETKEPPAGTPSESVTEAADNTEVSTAFASAENGVDSLPDSKASETVRSDTGIEESGENVSTTPAGKISDFVLDGLTAHRNITTQELQAAANDAYGGTMAEGAYDVKTMTDAMELGVNRYIIDLVGKNQGDFNTNNPNDAVESIKEIDEDILSKIPTQTKRTEEQISLQQFSTPPNIAYLASWVANIDGTDTVLEPSAGIGGLASFAKADGATVYVNELSDSRLAMLKELPFDGFYQENAEQIDNILPESVSPTVVLMNPPFSSTGGRTKNTTKNAIPHIEQALARLQDGGRLVAIVGKGMANDTPTFRGWYDTLRKNYSIRANIGINGENYRKYGTTFDVQLLVIDKTGAQTGETITGNYDDLKQIPELLKGVRNDRNRTDQQYTAGTGSEADYGTAGNDTGTEIGVAPAVSERDSEGRTNKRMERSDSGRRRTSGSDTVSGEQSGTVPRTDTAERNGTDGGGLDSGISRNPGETGGISERESASGTGEVEVRGSVGESDVRERMESGGRTSWGDDGQLLVKKKPAAKKAAEQDDGVYATYRPAALTVKGAKKHPAVLVESSAMSAVSSPELHYVPKLDQKLIDDGALSDAQLENISYAGQAHEQVLKNGARKGYFIGDGTGVGKGRQLAGIILDNFNQGRTKAVWVSEKKTLFEDAVRDWTDLGGDPAKVFDYSKDSVKKNISGISDGIIFVTYDTLKGGTQSKGGKQGVKHLDTIKNWLGEGFDGVIVFDEAHNMANLKPTKKKFGAGKPSEKAIAGNKFQAEVPDARIVYASATGATNIENLAYAQRLGLWGEGTNFVNEEDFISKIGRAGIAAMELVARDMKAMGVYLARSISYDGVVYDQLQHKLSKDQQYMYDTMSKGWQVVLQNFDKAMVLTDSTNSSQVKRARGQIYGNMQQFYNQVLSSMAMPSVIKDIEKELKAGHSCVIQLVNTNESAQDTAVSESKAKGETDLDNLDITPRQLITGYVNNAFPVQQYEEYLDEQGNKQSRPVVDSAGNPVLNRQAVKMRDALIAQINEISIPEGPLDMLINHFGADQVAEITGRSSRVVNKEDENGNIRKELEKRNSTKANIAETRDFQDGKKRILVFSSAGSTGRSYHADKRAKNQQKRIHYVLQPGWQADKAVQGFGRTHRSNQVDTPVFKLVSTDVMGHKRFVTSIARRLDQLGALTKGQRQTGSGVFGEKDNLESPLSSEALREFYKKMGNGQLSGIDPESTLKKLGLYEKFYDEYGRFKLNETVASDIPQFLNRILGLEVEEQNAVFTAFENIRQAYYDAAIESGTLDMGMENVKADKIEIGQEETVYTDESTGAETKYIRALVYNKPSVIESVEDARVYSPNFVDIRRMEDGSVRAVYRIADQTDNFGRVSKRYRLQSPNTAVSNTMNERNLESKTEKIPEKEWESSWKEAVHDVPEYNENEVHMITGALLPIWNRLPSDGTTKARRITTADGSQYLGRIIPPKQIDAVLRSFDVKGDNKVYTGNEIYDAVMKKTQTVVFNGQYGGTLTVSRRRVSGENRMEVTGGNLFALKQKYPDMITENIQFQNRYFIPSGEKGVAILSDMIDTLKVRSIGKDSDGDIYYKRKSAKETVREGKEYRADTPPSLDDLKITAEKMFHLPINYGKTGGKAGLYKTKEDTIRVAQAGDFLTIAHEIGHRLDNRYNLHSLPEVSELRSAFYEALEAEGYEEFQMPYEMVSEYFRSYLENAEETRKQFPKFTDAAFSLLDSRDTDNIARLSEMSNAYYDSETGKRAQAAVHNRAQENAPLHKFGVSLKEARYNPKGFIGETVKRLWDGFMINVFDDLYALKHFGSTYNMAMRERQANSVIRGWLNGNATDKYGEVLGSGITGRLSEFGVTPSNRNAFDSYLVDLAALDHMKQEKENPSGRPMGGRVYGDDRVQATVEKRIIEVESKYPGFHEAAQELFRYDDLLLSRAAQSGIISEETIKHWKEKYPHYSPLYRVMDDKTKIGGKARSRYTDQNNVFKAFKGSGRDIYSPVENRMIQTENVVKAAMRNDVALAFFDYVDANDNMGVLAEKIPQSMYKDIIGLFPAYQKLQKFDFKSLEKLSDAERQNVLDEVQEAMGNVAESWKPRQFQGKNVVAVMRNGKPVFYEIHDKAVLDALTSLSTPEMNVVSAFFSKTTAGFKVLTTGSNPFFAFTNFIRDTQSGYISSTTTVNPVKYTADLIVAICDTFRNTEAYQRFMDAGGGYEGSMTRDMKTLRSVEWDMVPHSTIERILHVPTRIWNAFARMVDIGESAQRLAEFKRAEKAGLDCLEAMREQQEVTVNFSRRGKIGKQIDSFVPYFNASLQSFYHMLEVLGENKDPKALKQAWAKFITMNLTMSILQQAFKIIGSAITGEDQEEEYNKLSGYIKNAYWCIPQGNGKFIRIPKQKDFMLLSTIFDRVVEFAYDENPRAFYEFTDYLSGVLMAPHSVEDVTIFGTAYALAKNETFTGAPIVSTAYQNLIPEEQFNENTSAVAKSIGALLNQSPMRIQFIMDDTTGFVGQFIEYAGNILTSIGEDGLLAGGKTAFDEFTSTFRTDNTYSTDEISYFYDTKEGYDARAATYKLRGNGDGYDFYDVYGAYKYGKIADVYSKCNRLIKADRDEESSRETRRLVNAFVKSVNDTMVSEMDEEVAAIAEAAGFSVSDIAPYIVTPDQITKRENNKSYYVELTAADMLEYYTETAILFELNYQSILQEDGTATEKAAALESIRDDINSYMREQWFRKLMERDGVKTK